MFLPLARSDAKWQLPVTYLSITRWSASGKELTRLLSHLPELSHLNIFDCKTITRLGVEAEHQLTAESLSSPVSSGVKLQDAHGTDRQQEVEQEVEEEVVAEEDVVKEEEEDDDRLLLLPAHLSGSLQELSINWCPELILIAQNSGAGGGLQAMRFLKEIEIKNCPKFFSEYKASGFSSCCPFPSSLRDLTLDGAMEGMVSLAPLSSLNSLEKLSARNWGEDFRCQGVLPLLTQGQLTALKLFRSPKVSAGWEPAQGLQGEQEQPSSKLQELVTDDVAGVLAAPICRLISSSLTKLTFRLDYEVERFTKEQEEALSLLTSLQELHFDHCKNLRCLPGALHKLTNLSKLKIDECPAIRSLPKNGLPSSLQKLVIKKCIKLRCLPAGLHKLINLKRLRIDNCPAIRSLPNNGFPSSLQELNLSLGNNEELTRRCRRLVGTIPLIKL